MASKLILALFFYMFFICQVSSDLNSNEETSNVSQVFNRGGERKLLQSIVLHLSNYFKNPINADSFALAPALAPTPSHPLECGGLCKTRCSLHSRQNVCIRACGTCCARCKCVPPGTSGNRELCGKCYTDMTTHNNKTKCP